MERAAVTGDMHAIHTKAKADLALDNPSQRHSIFTTNELPGDAIVRALEAHL
jgi:hypothetical protein